MESYCWLWTELPQFLMVVIKALFWSFLDFCNYFLPKAPKSVSDKVVLVTGASRGLGRHIALNFSDLGAVLVVWSSNQSSVDKVALEIASRGGRAYACQCDVRDEMEVERVSQKVLREVGPVDILINNAGVAESNNLIDMTTRSIRRIFDVNLMAHYWTIRQFLPPMMKQDSGHVVAVSSILSMINGPRASVYCATKHGMGALMDCVSQEAEITNPGNKIRFSTVCPSFFESGLATNIKNKMEVLFPLPSAEKIAQDVVEAVLYEKTHTVTPRRVGAFVRIVRSILSKRAQVLLQNFIDYDVEVVAR